MLASCILTTETGEGKTLARHSFEAERCRFGFHTKPRSIPGEVSRNLVSACAPRPRSAGAVAPHSLAVCPLHFFEQRLDCFRKLEKAPVGARVNREQCEDQDELQPFCFLSRPLPGF